MNEARHTSEGTYLEGMLEIKLITAKAIKAGHEVKWYCEYLPYSLVIYDPEPLEHGQEIEPSSDKAWIVIQHLEEAISRDQLPRKLIRKVDEPDFFNTYVKRFKEIWASGSRVPKPEEYVL